MGPLDSTKELGAGRTSSIGPYPAVSSKCECSGKRIVTLCAKFALASLLASPCSLHCRRSLEICRHAKYIFLLAVSSLDLGALYGAYAWFSSCSVTLLWSAAAYHCWVYHIQLVRAFRLTLFSS
jgi:hypothetical protein